MAHDRHLTQNALRALRGEEVSGTEYLACCDGELRYTGCAGSVNVVSVTSVDMYLSGLDSFEPPTCPECLLIWEAAVVELALMRKDPPLTRQQQKAANFGRMYGASPATLMNMGKVPR